MYMWIIFFANSAKMRTTCAKLVEKEKRQWLVTIYLGNEMSEKK